jgi:hypothetical protein
MCGKKVAWKSCIVSTPPVFFCCVVDGECVWGEREGVEWLVRAANTRTSHRVARERHRRRRRPLERAAARA